MLGPRLVDGAISLQPIESAAQLPKGVSDEQDGGSYRVVEGEPELTFQFVVGPDGPKRYLFPANLRLFEFHVEADNFVLDVGPPQVPKLAMLGVRACELAAIEVQDRVFGLDDPQDVPLRVRAVVHADSPGGAADCRQLHATERHVLLCRVGNRPRGHHGV